MQSGPPERAVVLTHGLFLSPQAKTTHAMIRGPSRYELLCVVDPVHAGQDARQLLASGAAREGGPGGAGRVPIVASLQAALELPGGPPSHCVVGVATGGGVLPEGLRETLLEAAGAGLTLVNGLHQRLSDDADLCRLVRAAGGSILDIRAPRPISALRFYTGEALELEIPRIAVLGTDCALGKRTTATWIVRELRRRGRTAELIYTGQSGWMQGHRFGFILDATPNDFVSGELENAILQCARESAPEFMLLEGQSSLRNPTGPCGAELIVSAGAAGVILQHAPGRRFFKGLKDYPIPPLAGECELIGRYGTRVLAVAINLEGLERGAGLALAARLETELGLPVVAPLEQGVDRLVDAVLAREAVP